MGVESPNYINLQCFHYFYLGCMKGKVLGCFVNPGTFCFSARSLVSCSIQLFDSILGKPFLLSSFCLFTRAGQNAKEQKSGMKGKFHFQIEL